MRILIGTDRKIMDFVRKDCLIGQRKSIIRRLWIAGL